MCVEYRNFALQNLTLMCSTPPNFRLYLFLPLFFLAACDNTGKEDARNKIIAGKWFIESAEKDGSKIRSLEGTIFDFSADGKMTTNVPQFGTGTYIFKNDILIEEGTVNQNYTVEDLTTEKLVLKTQVKDMDFKMVFGRDSSVILK